MKDKVLGAAAEMNISIGVKAAATLQDVAETAARKARPAGPVSERPVAVELVPDVDPAGRPSPMPPAAPDRPAASAQHDSPALTEVQLLGSHQRKPHRTSPTQPLPR